ncbi:MAG: FkbM family methyltransferase [Vampirovibrio sp.]|nr:FkbM family methyltransferase [Vampirovibrio sp.]
MLKRLVIKVLRRLGVLNSLNFTVDAEYGSHRYCVPMIHGLGEANLALSEPWMLETLQGCLSLKAGIFMDVGVNVGQTLIKVKALEPDRSYIGVEPNPTCIFYLQRLVQKNRYSKVRLLPVGFSNQTGLAFLDFFSEFDAGSSASIVSNFRPHETVSFQKCVPVFNYTDISGFLEITDLAIIKIDVEGAELSVLEGLHEALTSHRPLIILEILPVYDAAKFSERLARQESIESMMRSADYHVFRIRKTSKDQLSGFELVEEIGIYGDLTLSDYVMVPDELTQEFKTVFSQVRLSGLDTESTRYSQKPVQTV